MSKIILTDAQLDKVIAKCCDTFNDESHIWLTRFTFGGGVEKTSPMWEQETLELALAEALGYDVSFSDIEKNQIAEITASYLAQDK